jgi:hypothetical protein
MRKRNLWLGGLLLVLLALLVPFVSATFIQQSLQQSLEQALSRKVRIQGATRFRILPTPAILADEVTISEDPRFSLEPFAYVTEIEVQPSFVALLSGRLEASRIRLTEPSVNLMRSASGWNVQSLLSGNLRTPEIEVRNGRLNFKQGNSKSPFYLTNALVDLSAPTSLGDIKIFFSAEPARTDRGAQGFGTFSLRGTVHAPAQAKPDLDFDLELRPSSIHAFNFFFGARGVDFAGKLSGKGRLKGPWDQAELQAALQFEGLEPQGFLPFSGRSNQLQLKGSIDLPGQKLALDTVGGDMLRVRMRARDLFQAPRGGLLVQLRDVEFEKLLELGREASAKLPEGLSAKGKFNGVIGYSWPSVEEVPAKGMIWFADASMQLPDQPLMTIPTATAVVEGSRWILNSSEIKVGESQSAVMHADWNARSGALQLEVATQQLSVKSLKSGLGLLLQASTLPLLARAQTGSWQGTLQYNREEEADPGRWSGRLSVRNTEVPLDGLAAPLQVSSASISFDPNRIAIRRMRAEWNSLELEGEASYSPVLALPTELNLTIAEAASTDITALLLTSQRPPTSLLEKMRLRRSSMPDWLRSRNVVGTLRLKNLTFGAGSFDPMLLKFSWKAEKLEATLQEAEFSMPTGPSPIRVQGKLSADLWQAPNTYQFDGSISGWPVEKNFANWTGGFKCYSLDSDWLDRLDGEGTLSFTENPTESMKLLARQGKLSVEFPDAARKPILLAAPYWPLSLPLEP